jgi:Flp pilus assembly protein TadD
VTSSLPPRRLIPRWRRTSSTLDLPEAFFSAATSKQTYALNRDQLSQSIADWRDTPTTGHLGDVLAFSVDLNLRDEILVVAREVLKRAKPVTLAQKSLISSILEEPAATPLEQGNFEICNPATRREVSELRRVLQINPSNPLALLDTAQYQISSGKEKHAERSLRTALSLSPNSRIALRTLARFYVHTRKYDEAHRLLSGHARTPGDPWLMASEIALAEIAETSSHFASKGQRLVRDKGAKYADLSELAGALGGRELVNGNVKRARDMFRVALRSPNDNVIAQAITHQRLLAIDLNQPEQRRVALSASEAQTLLAWETLNTGQAELHALAWHYEEPFSSRPLQFLTTLYAVQNKYEHGINLAHRGLIADPKDSTLLANLSYLLANSGNLELAESVLRRLIRTAIADYDPIVLATNGLIAMKRGGYEVGDQLYLEAISRFKSRGELKMETNCLAYYARSAVETSHPHRDAILKKAIDAYSIAKSSDAAIILNQLNQKIEPLEQTEPTRRLSQWILDEKTNTLTQRHGITKEGAPSLIIKR